MVIGEKSVRITDIEDLLTMDSVLGGTYGI